MPDGTRGASPLATGAAPGGHAKPHAASGSAESQDAEAEPFRPLLDAGKGEWARYIGLDASVLHYQVEEVTSVGVRTRVTVEVGGERLGLPAIREDPPDFDPAAPQRGLAHVVWRAGRTRITAAGRQWEATLYEDRWLDEDIRYVRRTWVSPQVPVFGFIRMELYGDDQLEARLELSAMGAARTVNAE